MTVGILVLACSFLMAAGGRVLMYATQFEAWLEWWAYGAYGFAALLALTAVVEFFKGIVRACRRRRAKRGTMPLRHHRHKLPRH